MRDQSEVDLYLQGEDGVQALTDYNCSFVFKSRHYVQRIAACLVFLYIKETKPAMAGAGVAC